jgi:hypothetical protein
MPENFAGLWYGARSARRTTRTCRRADVLTCRMANRTPSDNQAPSASLAKYDMVPNYKSTEDHKRFVTEVIESERNVIDTLGLAKKTN